MLNIKVSGTNEKEKKEKNVKKIGRFICYAFRFCHSLSNKLFVKTYTNIKVVVIGKDAYTHLIKIISDIYF
jgi:hypothetical protein